MNPIKECVSQDPMTPTLGRIVLYKLSSDDVGLIKLNRHHRNVEQANEVKEGQEFPAIVVAKWGNGGCVNLRVFLDGDDMHWATSRNEGEGSGSWHWPAIEKPDATIVQKPARPGGQIGEETKKSAIKKEDEPPAK